MAIFSATFTMCNTSSEELQNAKTNACKEKLHLPVIYELTKYSKEELPQLPIAVYREKIKTLSSKVKERINLHKILPTL